MELIKDSITEIDKLRTNLKKSINKSFSRNYIEEKFEKLQFLKQKVNEIIKSNNETEKGDLATLISETEKEDLATLISETKKEDLATLKSEFDKQIEEVENILKSLKIKEEKVASGSNMASFDIAMVGKNLQVFKGSFEFLDDFITQTELLHDLIKEEDKEVFIKYVYNFKLSTQVRSILGRSNKPTTFRDLKELLEKSYPNPKTLQHVLTELGTLTQGNLNISDFREKISELSDQLSKFEIDNLKSPSKETKEAIYKVSENMALNIFIKGVNPEYKTILLANMPKNLSEATRKCVEAEQTLGLEHKKLFTYNKQYNYNNKGYNNYNNKGYNNNKKYQGYNNNNYNKNNNQQRNGNNDYNKNGFNRHGNNNNGYSKNGYNNNKQRNNEKHNNKNYQNYNNNNSYDKNHNYNQKHYSNNGYKNFKGNDQRNGNNNNKDRNYRAFPYTEEQGNCEGRMTDTVIQEGQI